MNSGVQPARETVTAAAPAGIGNLAVGFDVLGQALAEPIDTVTLRVSANAGVRISAVTGVVRDLPMDPERNAATAGIARMLREHDAGFGVDVEIEKGISIGSGMGGSAASAVAGVVAADALLGLALDKARLLSFALDGEQAATGARHADNVASALCGGIAMVSRRGDDFALVSVPSPANVFSVLVHPHIVLETRASRAALPAQFTRSSVIEQHGYLAAFISACYRNDIEAIGDSLRDVLVEPYRAALIPGFKEVKAAALASGALGCSISGGGPSVFAWCHGQALAERAAAAMRSAFEAAGIAADSWISSVAAPPARIIE